jgi:hypothetical protein
MSKRNKNRIISGLILILIVAIIIPVMARADIEPYTLEQGIPFIGKRGDVLTYDSFEALFKNFVKAAYIIAAIAAFIKILIAGIRWFTSGGSPKAISQSREDIKNGIIGLCFLLLAGVFIEFINPNLNKISSVFIGDIKVTPIAATNGNLNKIITKIGTHTIDTNFYAQPSLASGLMNSGLAFSISTGCRKNDGTCDPNYCGASPYTCSPCAINNDPNGGCKPLVSSNVQCHFNGNCVDLVPTNGDYTAAINKLNAAGLDVLNESLEKCSTVGTGDHLHVSTPGTFVTVHASDPDCWFTAAAYAAQH